MASSKQYLGFILDQLSDLEEIAFRPMMGEYLLYYRGKLIGGIYDDRMLIKPAKAAERLLPHAPREVPYPGAKEMILITDPDDREGLEEIFREVYPELPEPKKKKTPH